MVLKNIQIKILTYIFLTVVSAFLFTCDNSTEPDKDVPAIDFKMETVNGDTLQLSNTLGKVVILQFMQYDCPACQAEVPILNQIYDEYNKDEVVVWAISFPHSAEDEEGERTFLKENFINQYNPRYPILIDNQKYTSVPAWQAYSVSRTPTTIFINKEGYIDLSFDNRAIEKEEFDEIISRLL